jgi:hypothetical protein
MGIAFLISADVFEIILNLAIKLKIKALRCHASSG